MTCEMCEYCRYPRTADENGGLCKCRLLKNKTIEVYVGGGETPSWCPRKEAEVEIRDAVAGAVREVYKKCGMEMDECVDRLLHVYYSGSISRQEICKLHWKDKPMSFADVFREVEKMGHVDWVYVFNTNRNYIVDTPYVEGSYGYIKEHGLYTSDETVENFLFNEEEGELYIYYFRR